MPLDASAHAAAESDSRPEEWSGGTGSMDLRHAKCKIPRYLDTSVLKLSTFYFDTRAKVLLCGLVVSVPCSALHIFLFAVCYLLFAICYLLPGLMGSMGSIIHVISNRPAVSVSVYDFH